MLNQWADGFVTVQRCADRPCQRPPATPCAADCSVSATRVWNASNASNARSLLLQSLKLRAEIWPVMNRRRQLGQTDGGRSRDGGQFGTTGVGATPAVPCWAGKGPRALNGDLRP
jgi:hypothetical protein